MVKRLNYLNELWLPRVQSEGAHFGEMDSQAPVRRRKPLERKFKAKFVCVCVCLSVYLCMPEQMIQSVMPRLMEAQSGPGSPQSQHCLFPGIA